MKQFSLFTPLCWGCNGPLGRKKDFCAACRRELFRKLATNGCLLRYEGKAVTGLLSCLRGSAPRLAVRWCFELLERKGLVERWRGVDRIVLAPQNRRPGESGLYLLGLELGRALKVPVSRPFVKAGGRSQHGRSLSDRMDTVCFVELRTGESYGGKNLLLLDDVDTTGTTLDQCAYLLRKAGAGEVVRFSLARQMMPGFERKNREPEQKGEEVDPLLLHLFM